MMKLARIACGVLAAVVASPAALFAQAWPATPLRIISPHPPGGPGAMPYLTSQGMVATGGSLEEANVCRQREHDFYGRLIKESHLKLGE